MTDLYVLKATTNLWDAAGKVWIPYSNPIVRKLPKTRGKGCTIIGALTSDGEVYTRVVDATNKGSVLEFFRILATRIDMHNATICLDNHAAHWSHMVRDFLQSQQCEILFQPPVTSFFNPIETFWAQHKRRWR